MTSDGLNVWIAVFIVAHLSKVVQQLPLFQIMLPVAHLIRTLEPTVTVC